MFTNLRLVCLVVVHEADVIDHPSVASSVVKLEVYSEDAPALNSWQQPHSVQIRSTLSFKPLNYPRVLI